jgi:hypothetical protein
VPGGTGSGASRRTGLARLFEFAGRGRDRLGRVIPALLTACIFVVANRLDPF